MFEDENIIETNLSIVFITCRNGERPFHVTAVTVQVGDESLDGGQRGCSEIFSVDLIVPHPSYDMVLQNNDIALVMLMNDIDFVKKPCACKLCIKDKEPRAGSVCLVAGYGQTRQNSGIQYHTVWSNK